MERTSLPIREHADKIVKAVRTYPVTIVIGETGSGKTTQIAQVRPRQNTTGNKLALPIGCQ